MWRVLLTGGLCSGKSTVAGWLGAMGVPVLDADAIGHEFLAAGTPTAAALVNAFGPAILESDGAVNRAALARLAFADPAATRVLNAVLHPPIQAEIDRRLAELEKAGQPLAVVEAAVALEAGSARRYDRVVVVTCDREQKIQRFLARGRGTRAEAEARLAAQWPDKQKARHADFIIDNSGPLEATRHQVRDLFSELRSLAVGH
ncbi:MAG TPA: dephospho-CoA kinase [Terriglobales bacterium]|nr:dephospho-CoA kinase [Terriglobales bacterium]